MKCSHLGCTYAALWRDETLSPWCGNHLPIEDEAADPPSDEPATPRRRPGEWPAAMAALQSGLYRDEPAVREWVDAVLADYTAYGDPKPTEKETT